MGSPVATYPRITSSLRLANSTSVPSKNDTRWTWEQSSDLVKIKESKPVRWCLWPQCSPHWTPGVLTRSMLRWSCTTRQCSFTTETGHKKEQSCQPHGILCVCRLLVDPAIVRHNCIGSYKMVKWMVICSRNANFSWFSSHNLRIKTMAEKNLQISVICRESRIPSEMSDRYNLFTNHYQGRLHRTS